MWKWAQSVLPSTYHAPAAIFPIFLITFLNSDIDLLDLAKFPVDSGTSNRRPYEVRFKSSFVTNGRPTEVRKTN